MDLVASELPLRFDLQLSDGDLLWQLHRAALPTRQVHVHFHAALKTYLAVGQRCPKRNPGKWNQRLKHAVPWWFYFDPHPSLAIAI